MAYIDGFVIPVKTAGQARRFSITPGESTRSSSNMARCASSRRGATTCPRGKVTDLARAVQATGDETVRSAGSNGPTRRRATRR